MRLPTVLVIVLAAALVAPSPAGAAVKRLKATMSGAQETMGGDADGRGTATLRMNRARRRVCFTIRVRRIDQVMAAHIHRGRRGRAGGIVVSLIDAPAAGRRFRGCENGVSRRLIRRMLRRPGRFYVNVHTAAYPAGAVRGQLRRSR